MSSWFRYCVSRSSRCRGHQHVEPSLHRATKSVRIFLLFDLGCLHAVRSETGICHWRVAALRRFVRHLRVSTVSMPGDGRWVSVSMTRRVSRMCKAGDLYILIHVPSVSARVMWCNSVRFSLPILGRV